jgi:hypothetical protein
MAITVFWDMKLSSLANLNRPFWRVFCLRFQGRRASRTRKKKWRVYRKIDGRDINSWRTDKSQGHGGIIGGSGTVRDSNLESCEECWKWEPLYGGGGFDSMDQQLLPERKNSAFTPYTTVAVQVPCILVANMFGTDAIHQWCPTFLYIGAHLTDGFGGAGAMWRVQQQQQQ